MRIDSGPVSELDSPLKTPQDKWFDLMWVKRDFMSTRIKFDCRCLLRFVEEAKVMFKELGFDSVEQMIRKGYKLDPVEVEYALTWLRLKSPEEAATFAEAVQAGRKLAKHGGDRKSQEAKADQGAMSTLKRGSTQVGYIRARLARDYPEVLADLDAGKHTSARAAAIAAGIIKPKTIIEKALALCKRMSAEERVEFMAYFNMLDQ